MPSSKPYLEAPCDDAVPGEVAPDETGLLIMQSPPKPIVAAKSTRQPCLVVLQGPYEGHVLRLFPGTRWTLGRSSSAEFVMDDEGLSRTHVRIERLHNDFVIEDLGSRNGTYVNERPIKRHYLSEDDVVRVGASTLMRLTFMDALDEEMHERLASAASKDALTKVFNRRHFDERLAAEGAGARRHSRPLALIMVDVDNFKRVNDTMGHPAGDAVLRGVAACLSNAVRREDAVFRYGGEEFAVLLRETPVQGALILAERLRIGVEQARHEGPGIPAPLQVTVSVGVAMLGPGNSDEQLIHAADQALYQAKHSGKNRVVHNGATVSAGPMPSASPRG
ncbi:MAG: GGDEF domain-containing protein [Deltaproteobacteria bacterium]|nr:GGDEF domain-containing protein [Deltaproteobacteria bacterium]